LKSWSKIGEGWGMGVSVWSPQAVKLVLKCAVAAWCTCKGVQIFLWNRWSLLAFQIYQRRSWVLVIVCSVELEGKMFGKICWTPSGTGSMRWVKGFTSELSQTYLGKLQRKNRWESFSTAPQVV
jgi:hypothetical protein